MQTGMHEKAAAPAGIVLALCGVLALMAWVFWPVTGGDFVVDDDVFITTARMIDAPWAAFWQSHFYEPYYFRPLGVVSWWLAWRAFGLDYLPHALINLVLHGVNVLLLVALLRALAVRGWALVAAAALVALAPFGLAPAMWPSNRFDVLATGFLLLLGWLLLRALASARPTAWLLGAAVAALAACWSKEMAYPVATAMALAVLAARSHPWTRRWRVFAVLGAAIGAAFLWRHGVLADAYAVVIGNPLVAVTRGLSVMTQLLPGLVTRSLGGGLGWLWLAALALLVVVSAWGGGRRGAGGASPSGGAVLAAAMVMLAAVLVQTPLAQLAAPLADGSAFGTVAFLRFYYAPWVAFVVLVALLLARARWVRAGSLAMVAVALAGAVALRPLGVSLAQWVNTEVRPYAVAATAIADDAATDSPCLLVFLGTQSRHPYFRMFSDVAVKARAQHPDRAWRCFVMTESTPWLFAFPQGMALPAWPMPAIINPDGSPKADSTWSTIRYRYRLPPADLASLSGARFFDWRDGRFVEVTDEVRRGERKVPSRGWGLGT